MSIHIGKTISNFRKERALTQEQLAEVFGVSVAAVSKWETAAASPDIGLLPVIAEFFDISVDRLLGYDRSKSQMSISEHLKKANGLLHDEGNGKEAIAYLGKLAYRYPNDTRILVKYAEAKTHVAAWNPQGETRRKLFNEAEETLRSINTNGLLRNEYDAVKRALYGLYLWDKQFDKAEMLLREMAPDDDQWNDVGGAEFWLYTHMGQHEKAEIKYHSLLEKALVSEWLIYGPYHIYYSAPEPLIEICGKLIKTIILFSGGFSSFPYKQLSFLHECRAFMYARIGQKEDAQKEIEAIIGISTQMGEAYTPFGDLIKRDMKDEAAYGFITETYNAMMK